MSSAKSKVVVIGGGVIGIACAHYLAKAGASVVLVDRDKIGKGASSGNCGYICPSHILPLAEPGAVLKTLGTMFKRNSPLKIRFRFDPALWSWLVRFSLRCNTRDMLASGRAIQALLESSLPLFESLITEESLDCEWQKKGMLFAYKDAEGVRGYEPIDRLMTEMFHHPARRLSGPELEAFEPALKPGLAGGYFYEHDGHLRPDKLLSSWRKSLEARGVETIEDRGVERLITAGDSATAVLTNGGEIAGDAFVFATGALTPLLSRELGARIPIQPGKGYSITMPRPAQCPIVPIIFPETRVAVTPFLLGYRLGSTMEFAGYDAELNRARLDLLRAGVRDYLREPYCDPVLDEWFGWRPMTYDGMPIIDRAPGRSNVWIAAGHNMLGLSMATATGKLVAELVAGATPHIDPSPYRVERFGG